MSDEWLRIIPTDPNFVPHPVGAEQARTLLTTLAAADEEGREASVVDNGKVVFVDAGENFEFACCPWCGQVLDTEWWQLRMDSAFSREFSDLFVRTPCCDVTTSLNDLDYFWPQGFARWRLEVMNPLSMDLTDSQLDHLADAIGHPVRVVRTRY